MVETENAKPGEVLDSRIQINNVSDPEIFTNEYWSALSGGSVVVGPIRDDKTFVQVGPDRASWEWSHYHSPADNPLIHAAPRLMELAYQHWREIKFRVEPNIDSPSDEADYQLTEMIEKLWENKGVKIEAGLGPLAFKPQELDEFLKYLKQAGEDKTLDLVIPKCRSAEELAQIPDSARTFIENSEVINNLIFEDKQQEPIWWKEAIKALQPKQIELAGKTMNVASANLGQEEAPQQGEIAA